MINQITIMVLVSFFKIGYTSLSCPLDQNCGCTPGRKLVYDCERSMKISIEENKKINITCDTKDSRIEVDLLPKIDFGNVSELFIQDCELLEEDIEDIANKLDKKRIKIINLKGNKLDSIESDFFEEFKKLEEIKIHSSTFLKLDEDAFEKVKNLKHLILRTNRIKLNKDLFRHLSSLEFLDLLGNQIKDIPHGMFKKLSNLKTLHLWSNYLTRLDSSTFSGVDNLKVLDLSNNLLETIDSDTFSKLQNLQKISLSSNKLQHLSPELFQNNKQLKEIRIRSNKLELKVPDYFFANLDQLKTIDLTRSGVQTLPKHVFQNLKSLQTIGLEDNKLSSLPQGLFTQLVNLKNVNLRMNLLAKIETHQFRICGNESYTLNLENNFISEIDYFQEKSIENVKRISLLLKNNNITCSCSNYNFLIYIQRKKILGSNKNQMLHVEGVGFLCKNITQQLSDCKVTLPSAKSKASATMVEAEEEEEEDNNICKTAKMSQINSGMSNKNHFFKTTYPVFITIFIYVLK